MKIIGVVGLILALMLPLNGKHKKNAPAHETPPAQQLNGILNIFWGDSPDVVRTKLLKQPGVSFVSDSAFLFLRGGTFMGHEVESWTIDFWLQKYFWSAGVQFKADTSNSQSLAADLEQQLNRQYGKRRETFLWTYPVQGVSTTNDVQLLTWPTDKPQVVELSYSGHGYADSLSQFMLLADSASINTRKSPR